MEQPIVFVQLPVPRQARGEPAGNIPLAGAVLSEALRANPPPGNWRPIPLPQSIADNLADEGIVQHILAANPRAAGFTLFSWNLLRSIRVARLLRQRQPELLLIAGGPETVVDNTHVYADGVWDALVSGEGEQPLIAALADPAGLTGMGQHRWLPEAEYAQFPTEAPYASGAMPPSPDSYALAETARGCPFMCAYCAYAGRHSAVRRKQLRSVAQDLAAIGELGHEEVYLLDPTLNSRPDLPELIAVMAAAKSAGVTRFHAELRADLLLPRTVASLVHAGLTSAEIGLQTIHRASAHRVGRSQNLKKFIAGANALRAAGVHLQIDLILGLPGETLADVTASMTYLADAGLGQETLLFPLAVLPGTQLRQLAATYGIVYDSLPPYHTLRTNTMSQEDIGQAWAASEEILGLEFDAQQFPVPLTDKPFTTIELPVGYEDLAVERTAQMLPRDQVPNCHVVVLRYSVAASLRSASLVQLLQQWQRVNAFGQFDLILAPQNVPDDRDLENALRLIQPHPGHYLDRSQHARSECPAIRSRRIILAARPDWFNTEPSRITELAQLAPLVWTGQPCANAADLAEQLPEALGYLGIEWADV